MRRWLTIMVFVLALAVPAFAQSNSSGTQQQGQSTQSSQQGGGSGSQQTSTTTTTTKTTQVERATGVDPLYLAIGGIALITIIAIALLAARSRRGRDTVAVRETTTVVKD